MKDKKNPLAGIPGAIHYGQPYPSFRRSNHSVSSGAATASKALSIFTSNVACTIQWVIVQTTAACTIQMLLNAQPFTLPLAVGAGAIVRFAGSLLANNESLSLSVTANSTLNFEVVWIKDVHPEHIVIDTAVIYPGSNPSGNTNVDIFDSTGLAITAASDAPVGTESAIIAREIPRKKQALLTSTPLAANGVFTSAWFDSELTGSSYVQATGVSNVASVATTGLVVQESEDQANVRSVANQGAALITRAQGYIRARYWRVVYTNGATIQASFSLYVTDSIFPFVGSGVNNASSEPVGITSGSSATTLADGLSISSGSLIVSSAGSGGLQGNITYLFNGATFDRPRTPAIFKQVSTAATGSTALWTPAAGKKFRLMRYRIQVTASAVAAVAADLTIALLDAAADLRQSCFVSIPNAGLTAGVDYESGWIDLGNGMLSALANNVLNLNLSFALTGGKVNITACGTEE